MGNKDDNILQVDEQFRVMADSAPVMMWVAGRDKLCYFFNQGWLSFSGRKMEEEMGNGWMAIVHPADIGNCLDVYMKSFDRREAFRVEYRLKRFDGKYRWVLDNGVPRQAADGSFAGYIGCSVDIQDKMEMEERKNEFISAASHELKTPVTTINLYAQIIKEELVKKGETQLTGFIEKIGRQSAKLTLLINQLLDISKIQGDIFEMEKEPFQLSQLLESVVEDFSKLSTTHTIVPGIHSSKYVFGDKERITQVVNNLLTNAIKYSPGQKEIIVNLVEEGNMLKTSFTDFGIGIPKAHHSKIFERFYRVTDKYSKTYPGLGLGLYISHKIIQLHEGRIWVESEPNKQTTFMFTLPCV